MPNKARLGDAAAQLVSPETQGLFDGDLIAVMRRDTYLINISRILIAGSDAIVRGLNGARTTRPADIR